MNTYIIIQHSSFKLKLHLFDLYNKSTTIHNEPKHVELELYRTTANNLCTNYEVRLNIY